VHESRARRHVTEDTSDQGQKDTIPDHQSINPFFINELIYLNFVTVMSPVCRLKKLSSYYLVIWRNSTSLLDSTPYRQDADSDRNPTSIIIGRDSMRFHEILWNSTLSLKDDPDDKDDPNNKIPSQFPICLLVKITLPTLSLSTTIILNKLED